MSDNNDKMDELNDAFGMLLSVWANYFTEDNPAEFFTVTGPVVQDFLGKYRDAEAAAKSALPTESSPIVDVSPGSTTEDIIIQSSNKAAEQSSTGSDLHVLSSEDYDSSFVTAQEDQQSDTSMLNETLPAELVEAPMETSVLVSTHSPSYATLPVNTQNLESPGDTVIELMDEIVGQIEKQCTETLIAASDLEEGYPTASLNMLDENAFDCGDTFANTSRKRKLGSTGFDTTLDKPAEPSVKRPKFSDLITGPLNPQMCLFGSSRPEVHLHLGNGMNNVDEECSHVDSLDEMFDDELYEDSLVTKIIDADSDATSIDKSCVVEDVKTDVFNDVNPVLTVVGEPLSNPILGNDTSDDISIETNNSDANKDISATSDSSSLSETYDEPCVDSVEEIVTPQPEMPSYFPSLFGRSVCCDPSPIIESPEKFSGVYETLYKDLLHNLKRESEEEDVEEVMPMETNAEQPIENVSSFAEPQYQNDFYSVNKCLDDSAIHNLVDEVLDIVSANNDTATNLPFTLTSEEAETFINNEHSHDASLNEKIVENSNTSSVVAVDKESHDSTLENVVGEGSGGAATPGVDEDNVQNSDELLFSHIDHAHIDPINHGTFDFEEPDTYSDSDLLNSDIINESSLAEQSTAVSFDGVSHDNNMDISVTEFCPENLDSDSGHRDSHLSHIHLGSQSGFEDDEIGGNRVAINLLNGDTEQDNVIAVNDVDTVVIPNEMTNEDIVAPSGEFDDSDTVAEESKLVINNNNDNVTDEMNDDDNNQSSQHEAPTPFQRLGSGRSAYIPPSHKPEDFLITGRRDGVSSHFIPIFKQNAQLLAQPEEQEAIVPYALRDSSDQTERTSGESKAEFKQAVDAIKVEAQPRLSLQDVVARHNTENDEVIELNSDNEDSFNQTAKEFILETDAASTNPQPVKVHPSLTKILKKHQTEGISFLYKCLIGKIANVSTKDHTGAILAHCMGLGKTLQVIAFLHTVLTHPELRKHLRRVLILCPAGVVINWCQEFKAWLSDLDKSLDTLKVYEVSTSQKGWDDRTPILKKWAKDDRSVVIMSYDMYKLSIKNLSPHLLTKPGPDILVCDESHILNSANTQIFDAVRKIPTLRRIALTGTPIQNSLMEYYQMVDFVTPGLLGTLKDFKKKFMEPIGAATTKEAEANDVDIMKKKSSVLWKQLGMVMNRKNFSVLSKILPKKRDFVIFIRLSEPQRKLYEHYLNLKKNTTMLAQRQVFADEHTVYRIGTFPYLVKMAQQNPKCKKDKNKMGDWYSGILDSYKCTEKSFDTGSKLVLFVDLLKLFEKLGEKTIVFTFYLEVIDVLVKMLESKANTWFSDKHPVANYDSTWSWKRDKDYYVIQGDTAAAKRHKMIQDFNDPKNKRGRLFFCSDAGTVGTNMTGGSRVIIFESKHNPAKEIQAIFRSYRIGQKKPVFTYRLVAEGTMEDCVLKRQIVKQQIQARVLDNEGVSRTIEGTDINELLRFTPAPLNVDFTTQADYAPTGDADFDQFCMDHRHLIVEVRDHDALIAFNEEEKLSVDVADNEWKKHLHGHSLQDEVFRHIQEEESAISLDSGTHGNQQSFATEDDIITISDVQQPSVSGRQVIPQVRIVRPTAYWSPYQQFRNIRPNLIRPNLIRPRPLVNPISRPRTYSITAMPSTNRPVKRQKSPEVVCLDDDDDAPPPSKAAKRDAKDKKNGSKKDL